MGWDERGRGGGGGGSGEVVGFKGGCGLLNVSCDTLSLQRRSFFFLLLLLAIYCFFIIFLCVRLRVCIM